MDTNAEREVIEGDPALVTSDNFRLVFPDEEGLRAFLANRAPPGTTAVVRRAEPASSSGAEWELYARGWDPWGGEDFVSGRTADEELIDFEDL